MASLCTGCQDSLTHNELHECAGGGCREYHGQYNKADAFHERTVISPSQILLPQCFLRLSLRGAWLRSAASLVSQQGA